MSSVNSDNAFTPTVGAFEIGVMVSIFLFGLVTVQTFSYYKKFPNDPWAMRIFVGVLWAMELAHTMLTAHSLYWISVVKYGQPEFIIQFPTSLIIAVVFSGIIGPAVQAFFANRVRKLSKDWIIPCICWLLSFLRFISLVAVAAAARNSDAVTFRKKWLWLLVSSLSISTAVDVLIAASLCYYLWHRRDGSFPKTKRLVDKLIVWAIQTGLLTSLTTITMLILFIVADNFAWIAVFFIISRLFSNSLMASLNARTNLRALSDKVSFMDDSNFHMQSTLQLPPRNINVAMTRVTEQWDIDLEPQKLGADTEFVETTAHKTDP